MPEHRSAIGMVVGAGIQFVDEFGIHVVPEVRYTRWVNPIFDNLTTKTQTNQVEAGYFAHVLASVPHESVYARNRSLTVAARLRTGGVP